MISNFFSKSKPIHYIVISVIVLLVFVLMRFPLFSSEIGFIGIIKQLGLFCVALFTVFVFDFLVSRNGLTKKNSYNILLFVLYFAILPETLSNTNVLFANLFILLALRRIISLRSQKEIKKKLFDASVFVGIATLFYLWSIVFFVLIFAALLVYAIADLKNYVIPFVGGLTVAVITISYMILTEIDITSHLTSMFDYSLDYSALNSKRIIIGATLLLSFGLWALFYYIKNIKSKMKSYRPSFKLIILCAILGLLIVAIAPLKNGSEFIFLFAPLSIIMTNYIEIIEETWFKESLLWILSLTPILLLLL